MNRPLTFTASVVSTSHEDNMAVYK
uniref:ENSMUSG00000051554 protein n=1 Tax=Mus musculus TaxID=10090 RepID=Q8K3C6_MOUSE|nr:ENSMUSG00000051554 protein [Mus musculus]